MHDFMLGPLFGLQDTPTLFSGTPIGVTFFKDGFAHPFFKQKHSWLNKNTPSAFRTNLVDQPPRSTQNEYLTFLEKPDDVTTSLHAHINHLDLDDEEEDFDDFSAFDHSASHKKEDKHVFVLKERNFTIIIENNRFVMQVVNAPWCSDCYNQGRCHEGVGIGTLI
ncbi:unnamed protein product [Lupinus luteus]|uniref:Uncharacterized protein n=1 Tax=Lupinus luteus TaxID=3873 RepID=A0AAV1Y3N8_LUPLU